MRNVACAILAALVSVSAFGDAITIEGTRYEDVLVRESPMSYHVWLPSENRTITVAKDKARDALLTQDPAARGKLIQAWARSQDNSEASDTAKRAQAAVNTAAGKAQTKLAASPDSVPDAPATNQEPGVMTAQSILDAYAQQQNRIHAFTVHYNDTIASSIHTSGEWVRRCHEGWFSQDFRQNRHIRRDYQWQPDKGRSRAEAGFMVWRWDGTAQYQYWGWRQEGTISRGNDSVARELAAHPLAAMCRGFGGKDLMGYPIQAELRLDQFLQGGSLALRPQMERVGIFHCAVIEASVPAGFITAWFAPEQGYSIIQYTIDKGTDSVYQGAHIEVTVTELQEVDGLWLPKSGRAKEDWRMLDGGFIMRDTTVQLDSFAINPDFDKDGTFDLTKDVPDGSIWRYMDSQHIAHRWVKGELVPIQ